MTEVGLTLPIGEVTLPPEVLEVVRRHPAPANVIAGVRPEHFEDATLIDGYERIRALTFETKVDIVESLGADKYVYFATSGAGARSAQLAELAAESGAGENELWQGFPPIRRRPGPQSVELALDTTKLHIFDADSG